MSDQFDLMGVTPNSWVCVDCGINIAPGYPTRAEMERQQLKSYISRGRSERRT